MDLGLLGQDNVAHRKCILEKVSIYALIVISVVLFCWLLISAYCYDSSSAAADLFKHTALILLGVPVGLEISHTL